VSPHLLCRSRLGKEPSGCAVGHCPTHLVVLKAGAPHDTTARFIEHGHVRALGVCLWDLGSGVIHVGHHVLRVGVLIDQRFQLALGYDAGCDFCPECSIELDGKPRIDPLHSVGKRRTQVGVDLIEQSEHPINIGVRSGVER
jgi:hypothetical protein